MCGWARQIPNTTLPPGYALTRDVPLDLAASAEPRKRSCSKVFGNADPNIRAHAIEALQAATGGMHGAELIAALSDKDPLVRYAACLAVAIARRRAAHGDN